MSDATVFVSIAFAIVWMKRKNRWRLFFQALEGSAVLASSSASSTTPTAGNIAAGTAVTNTNTTPGNNPNEAPITVGPGDKAA